MLDRDKSEKQKHRRGVRLCIRIFAWIAALVLILEFSLRTILGLASPVLFVTDDNFGYIAKKGGRHLHRFFAGIDTNQYGMRSTAVSDVMKNGEYRILLVGDSVPQIVSTSLPAAVVAAGYTMRTFGPNLTLGTNWFLHNFYKPAHGGATQQGSGIYLDGTGNGAGICTAQHLAGGHAWSGIAFGGGGYFEAVLSFPPSATVGSNWPAFWSQDIETLSQNAVTPLIQWPGQAANYGNWEEPDVFEANVPSTNQYGGALHNWFGIFGARNKIDNATGSPFSIGGANFANPNVFGFLWVPATATTQGFAQWYFNGVQVGKTVFWNQYNPALGPPPVAGSSAQSVLDQRHLSFILSTDPIHPMTVYSMSVYQASAAYNLTSNPRQPGATVPIRGH